MTILSTVTYSAYVADGVTLTYDTNFSFEAPSDVAVSIVHLDNTVELLTAGYTVAGAGNPAGGEVTLAGGVAVAGEKVLIERATPQTQPVVYTYNDLFPAKTHEGALDRLTRMVQENAHRLDVITGKVPPILPITYQGLFLTWRESWLAVTPYNYGDTVAVADHEGSIYVCKQPHTSGATFDPANWSLMLDQTGIDAALDAAEAAAAEAAAATAAAEAAASSATTAATAATNAGNQAEDAKDAAEAATDTAEAAATTANVAASAAAAAQVAAEAAANKIPTPGPSDGGKIPQVKPDGSGYELEALSGVSVSSVFGRVGSVIANNGDYAAVQVTEDNAGNMQAAVNALSAAVAGKQNLDAMLTALAALVTANDKGLMFTGPDAPALFDLSAFARTFLDDANGPAVLATLAAAGLALQNIFTDFQQIDVPGRNTLFLKSRNNAAQGVQMFLDHIRAAPAALDYIAGIVARANDNTPSLQTYGSIAYQLMNVGAAAKAGEWQFYTAIANAQQLALRIGNGIAGQGLAPMGVAGSANFTEYYKNGVALATGYQRPPRLHLAQVQASGTSGGSNGATGAYQTVALNTKMLDEIGVTLSGGQWTLPAGTYVAQTTVLNAVTDNFKSRLQNVSDASMLVTGSNSDAPSSLDCNYSHGFGVFVLAAAKACQLQRRSNFLNSSNGGGVAVNYGESEIYSQCIIDKVA